MIGCAYCRGGKDFSPLVGVDMTIFSMGPSLYVSRGDDEAVMEIRYCPFCGSGLYGVEPAKRIVYFKQSYWTAKRWAPWAYKVAQLKDGGCVAFEAEEDYAKFVKGGRVFEPPKISVDSTSPKCPPSGRYTYKGNLFWVDSFSRRMVKAYAPWATKIVPTDGGGYMAFEYGEDYLTWVLLGMPYIPCPNEVYDKVERPERG